MKSKKITKKILHLERSEIPHRVEFTPYRFLEVGEVGNCITITGFSYYPVVSRLLRKMLFVGVCHLSPKGFSLERRNIAS